MKRHSEPEAAAAAWERGVASVTHDWGKKRRQLRRFRRRAWRGYDGGWRRQLVFFPDLP